MQDVKITYALLVGPATAALDLGALVIGHFDRWDGFGMKLNGAMEMIRSGVCVDGMKVVGRWEGGVVVFLW
jgi:hypothetical protein